MNIFVLSQDPIKAARMQCDQHVVKMPLESAQMLCAAFRNGRAPYRRTHYNHPCTIWARGSKANYMWLATHGLALCDEYEFRYGRIHRSKEVILWCRKNCGKLKFSGRGLKPFVMAMPDKFKKRAAVSSYRNFYIMDKSRFARWRQRRKPPAWYVRGMSLKG